MARLVAANWDRAIWSEGVHIANALSLEAQALATAIPRTGEEVTIRARAALGAHAKAAVWSSESLGTDATTAEADSVASTVVRTLWKLREERWLLAVWESEAELARTLTWRIGRQEGAGAMARALVQALAAWLPTRWALPAFLADARACHALAVVPTVDRANLVLANVRQRLLGSILWVHTPASGAEALPNNTGAVTSTLWVGRVWTAPVCAVLLLAVGPVPFPFALTHLLFVVPLAVWRIALRCRWHELLL